jgi:hypothetical protein
MKPPGVIDTKDLAGLLLLHKDQVVSIADHLKFSPCCWSDFDCREYGREGYEYHDAKRIAEFCLANAIDRINADFNKAFSVITTD